MAQEVLQVLKLYNQPTDGYYNNMAKDEKKTITVNDVTHNIEDLNEQQQAMVNHIADLAKKLE